MWNTFRNLIQRSRESIYIDNKLQYIKYKLPLLDNRYIIYWYPNSITNIHGHDNLCKYMLLKGNVTEELYKSLHTDSFIKTNPIKLLHANYINDSIGYHKLINSNIHSISYHVYS